MNKTVYIVGDLPVTLADKEYRETFSEEQIVKLEENKEIEWTDKDGVNHLVGLIPE